MRSVYRIHSRPRNCAVSAAVLRLQRWIRILAAQFVLPNFYENAPPATFKNGAFED